MLLAFGASQPVAAQSARVIVGGSPTNMIADWGQVVAVPDGGNSFLLLAPLSSLPTWAEWEPDLFMDSQFGSGNWSRLRLAATEWAYLSADPCAHQPAAGAVAPLSLLTSSYDFGAYTGVAGTALFPDATLFPGAQNSFVEGLPGWTFERWQLRTRGFFLSDLWNACPASSTVTPNFTGFVAVRFVFSVL